MKSWKKFLIAMVSIATIGTVAATVFGAYIVFWIGLHAAAEPSSFEATLARTVRNSAILRRERRAKNPLQATADNTQAGREDFLTQCAGCHGYDCSGLTPMGRNLYPRAPNLHSTMTQGVTDGELHYIIENGVPLTGWPACESCRADEYRRWKKTPMANIVRDPGQSPPSLSPT